MLAQCSIPMQQALFTCTDGLCNLLHLQMRGITVPGNVDGTVLRNGAAHRRRRRQAAAGKGARRLLSVQGGINKK